MQLGQQVASAAALLVRLAALQRSNPLRRWRAPAPRQLVPDLIRLGFPPLAVPFLAVESVHQLEEAGLQRLGLDPLGLEPAEAAVAQRAFRYRCANLALVGVLVRANRGLDRPALDVRHPEQAAELRQRRHSIRMVKNRRVSSVRDVSLDGCGDWALKRIQGR